MLLKEEIFKFDEGFPKIRIKGWKLDVFCDIFM